MRLSIAGRLSVWMLSSSVAVHDDGQVAVMFRNHIDGKRDMYLTRSADGSTFEAPAKLAAICSWPEPNPSRSGAAGVMLRRGTDTMPIGPGRFPALLSFDRHRLLAWEHGGNVHVRLVPR